jgi:hypothetical protein
LERHNQVKLYVVNQGHFYMVSPSQDTPTPGTLRSRSTEQDVIHQIQSELLALVRVTPDETIDWQKSSSRLGDWSSTLENEISRFLW